MPLLHKQDPPRGAAVVSPTSASSIDEMRELKRIHKQTYNRERLRRKTAGDKAEAQALMNQITALERTADEIRFQKSNTALSWKDIAAVFQEGRAMLQCQNHNLKKQVETQERIRRALLKWLSLSSTMPLECISVATTYKFTSLMADESTRKIGLEWIAKRLHHNLDPWIERSNMPVSMEPYFRLDVRRIDASDGPSSYVLEEYQQRVEAMPLTDAAACLERIYFEVVDGDQIEADEPRTLRYVRYQSWYGQTVNRSFHEKMLVRAIHEENRYIIFTHSISDDAKHPDAICNDWTAWIVAERLSPTTTVIKNGFMAYGMREASGAYFAVDEECAFLKDVQDEGLKFAKFQQYQRDYRATRHAGDLVHFARTAEKIKIEAR
ncbi:Aste57867_20046 [Aphanomyces stellatus]|uniref:Aste57867_20046 protein n=1 Tax=Aphanomyces stellatus TaxID=120398 RepID=A0A485LE57_9STRA|nr:hypothetical protein As57867_019980 [Aphanomyces stellatus]VFT96742.1 Aste57867_20046 [Aphanomyces stellatus]